MIALALPLTFGLYGAIRKRVSVESLEGLFIEVLLLAPLALAWMFLRDGAGLGQHGLKVDLFLLGAGAFTAIPLMTYVAERTEHVAAANIDDPLDAQPSAHAYADRAPEWCPITDELPRYGGESGTEKL